MAFTTYKFNYIFKWADEYLTNSHPYLKRNKNLILIVQCFFILGFAIGATDILTGKAAPIRYFVGVVFVIAACFAFFLMRYIEQLTSALQEQGDEVIIQNKNLQLQVKQQVGEVMYHDQMLQASNEVASLLLASSVEEFDRVLHECMGVLAGSVDADRMYIWKNHKKGDKLYCTQIIEWSELVEPQQDKDLVIDIPYDENIPGWEEAFTNGRSVNGLVRNLSLAEQAQLSPQGILSILVVPVYYKNEFWGFIGFDDCHSEREFSQAQEGILRTAGVLIATALLRNEMTVELIRAQEDALAGTEAKSRFLASMSHEIRTPINAITGMVAIAKDTEEKEKIYDYLEKIDGVTRQLLGIINDILDMSKIEAGKMHLASEVFDLYDLLDNVKNIIGVRTEEKNQELQIHLGENVPRLVEGDELRLTQILLNLLSNATKFTPEEGKIEVKIDCLGADADSFDLRFLVKDNGIGISKAQQAVVFKSFEQAEKSTAREYGGTGLGLVISKHIAEMMNGGITLESELGKGSSFTVDIKVKRASAIASNKHEEYEESSFSLEGKFVLLAEDIEINREIVITLLTRKGAKVHWGANGEEILTLFQKDPDLYDLILMDIQMPVMDGYEATEKIRSSGLERAETIPIIAMTANAFAEDVKKCLAAGMNGHIPKPVDVKVLYQTLFEMLT
ncbi:ATP-binding protein [Ohessyouella blattaphilus]|uniref:Stage 0 sporulation protein A homolog n=1 Tax=Ohessyouella blattaphilus TaxID=2949333 RepID=A0ABT1EIH9_9FIRM|nr:ATP-binding protein [Ohessyouella blattaphilus]MCP1109572.1 ATP-binding protein [Ohessyouella blattaphilus]MCR8562966.1 ATP-binding protein [Ohessyouella blattaphilus]MDL2250577.1 response regulator [Lachnospiraceae bacterium OttesenSCG-928-J05]